MTRGAAKCRCLWAIGGSGLTDARGVSGPHHLFAQMPAAPPARGAHQFVVVIAAEHAQFRDPLYPCRVVEHRAHRSGVTVDLGFDVGDVVHAHRHQRREIPVEELDRTIERAGEDAHRRCILLEAVPVGTRVLWWRDASTSGMTMSLSVLRPILTEPVREESAGRAWSQDLQHARRAGRPRSSAVRPSGRSPSPIPEQVATAAAPRAETRRSAAGSDVTVSRCSWAAERSGSAAAGAGGVGLLPARVRLWAGGRRLLAGPAMEPVCASSFSCCLCKPRLCI